VHLLAGRAPVAVVLAAAVAVSLLLAWVIHRFVERPYGPRLRRATTAGCERLAAGVRGAVRAVRSRYEVGTAPAGRTGGRSSAGTVSGTR
jgi:peptidoglycan/LPS O-acetylase OafA/YrhL